MTAGRGAVGKQTVPKRGRCDSDEPHLPLKLFYKKDECPQEIKITKPAQMRHLKRMYDK